jgi:hypothetical protein
MKGWEVVADNLSKSGWSWGCVATINSSGQTISFQMHIATMEGGSLCEPDES